MEGPIDDYVTLAAFMKGRSQRQANSRAEKKKAVSHIRPSVSLVDILSSKKHSKWSRATPYSVLLNIDGEYRQIYYNTHKGGFCVICNKLFSNIHTHSNNHRKGYLCKLCRSATIFKHITHSREHLAKFHSLTDCKDSVFSSSMVQVNLRNIPYTLAPMNSSCSLCTICDRMTGSLDNHQLEAHQRAWVCKLCPDDNVFYLPRIAEHHFFDKHYFKRRTWKSCFFKISTKSLPYLMPLPPNWRQTAADKETSMKRGSWRVTNVRSDPKTYRTKQRKGLKKIGVDIVQSDPKTYRTKQRKGLKKIGVDICTET